MPRTVSPALPDNWPFSPEWGAVRYFRNLSAPERPAPDFRAILRARWADTPPAPREEKIMGRLLTAIPTNAPVSVDVPDDVAKELDELYGYMVEHPEYMAQATFTKDDEHNTPDNEAATVFLAQAKEWGRLHKVTAEDGTESPDPLEIRKSPSRTLPEHVIRFNIRKPLTPEEVAANAKKNAAAKAKREAAAAAEAKAKK